MSAWKDFVTMSLLGTEKSGATATLPAAMGNILEPAGKLPPEAQFLTRAGALALWRRAGWKPGRGEVRLHPPSPLESLPLIPPTSVAHLRAMLGGHTVAVLPEWLGEVARLKKRLPPEWLPVLLERARQSHSWRPSVLAAGGARAAWLAACNPEWDFAAEAKPEHWETGNASQRFALLLHWRETDPAYAREKLAAVWKTEPAESRANFLPLLQEGLSEADTAFLEGALDDRSQHVRLIAVNLLSQLPGSPFVARMIARAEKLLTFQQGGLLRNAALSVTLPEPPDVVGQRDGLDPKSVSAQRTFGEKAGLLVQILAAVPLAHWTALFHQEPAALLQALKKNDFAQAVVTGWTLAAQRQRDAAWSEALLETPPAQRAPRDWTRSGELLAILPEAARAKRISTAIRGGSLEDREAWLDLHTLLLTFRVYLPVSTAQELLHAWRTLAARPLPGHLQSFQAAMALKIPPQLLPFALDDWPEPNPAATLVEVLSFRRDAFATLNQS